MENKHELTEKLKLLELEIYADKIDLESINRKLKAAYEYEEALIQRLNHAKKQTDCLRSFFFQKSSNISVKYDKVKDIVDVFTGNFYNRRRFNQ